MNITFGTADLAALSPLLILFSGTLILLLVEAFAETFSRKYASYITLATLTAALYAACMAPASSNPLLTPWVKFDSLARLFTIFFLIVGLASTLLAIPF